MGLALKCTAQHGHRVGVVEQNGVRAVFLHVTHDIHHRWQGTQEAEDAARTARIADIDVHAVFLGDFEVVPPDLDAAGQDGGQNHVSAFESFNPVECGRDGCRAIAGLNQFDHCLFGEFQPLGVDVHQNDVGIFQQGESQDVAHEVGGELETTGANEGDLGHDGILS